MKSEERLEEARKLIADWVDRPVPAGAQQRLLARLAATRRPRRWPGLAAAAAAGLVVVSLVVWQGATSTETTRADSAPVEVAPREGLVVLELDSGTTLYLALARSSPGGGDRHIIPNDSGGSS